MTASPPYNRNQEVTDGGQAMPALKLPENPFNRSVYRAPENPIHQDTEPAANVPVIGPLDTRLPDVEVPVELVSPLSTPEQLPHETAEILGQSVSLGTPIALPPELPTPPAPALTTPAPTLATPAPTQSLPPSSQVMPTQPAALINQYQPSHSPAPEPHTAVSYLPEAPYVAEPQVAQQDSLSDIFGTMPHGAIQTTVTPEAWYPQNQVSAPQQAPVIEHSLQQIPCEPIQAPANPDAHAHDATAIATQPEAAVTSGKTSDRLKGLMFFVVAPAAVAVASAGYVWDHILAG